MDAIRWGILGTGGIARKFAEGLALLPDARMTAVGSRTQASADTFGAEWKIPNRHGSYAALMADPEVDAVYVATPHTLHRENALGCLAAGKAVLCEKPFTINARQAEEVIGLARKKRIFPHGGDVDALPPDLRKGPQPAGGRSDRGSPPGSGGFRLPGGFRSEGQAV